MVFQNPGIYWDPREPIPPHLIQLEREIARLQHRQPREFADPNCENDRPRVNVQEIDPRQQEPDGNRHYHHRVQADEYVRAPDGGFLPPLSATVKAQIIQDTARVTITQLFSNTTNRPIPKAAYTFPLPQGCTVTEFVCRIGNDKILKGKVKTVEEAHEAFRDASRRQETTALLDQNTSEIFTTTIGNIPPSCRLKIEISFIFLLNYRFENGEALTTFTLPTYIAPRFGTPPPSLAQSSLARLKTLQLDLDVLAADAIASVKCYTHPVLVELGATGRECQTWSEFVQSGQGRNPKTAVVRLQNTVSRLDRDLVLEIRTVPPAGQELPHLSVELHPTLQNHRALMLTIPSNFLLNANGGGNNSSNGEIIFVADRSGSMSDKIVALKSAMQFFLKGIPSDRKFNIWSFGDRFESIWATSQPYSRENLQYALSYVQQIFQADMGGTMLLPALKEAVSARGGSQNLDIICLTDGEVWDLNDTLDYVDTARTKTEGRIRFFCLGIGAAVSHALVEGIAKAGGGYAEVISLASQGGWESRVVAVLKAALTDHLGPMNIEIQRAQGLGGRPGAAQNANPAEIGSNYLDPTSKMLQSPAQSFTLSPFIRNRVFMLFEAIEPDSPPTSVVLKSKRPGAQELSVVVPVKTLSRQDTSIHKLAARALLGDLERGQSHIHLGPYSPPQGSSLQKNMVAAEGERLGCKWSLVSKWTSFFAMEDPFQPEEGEADPFLDDGDAVAAIVPHDDLDLLRPRGAQRNNPDETLHQGNVLEVEDDDDDDEEEEEEEEEEEDADNSAKSVASSTYRARDRDDNDRDGPNAGGGGLGGWGFQHPPGNGHGPSSGPRGQHHTNQQGGQNHHSAAGGSRQHYYTLGSLPGQPNNAGYSVRPMSSLHGSSFSSPTTKATSVQASSDKGYSPIMKVKKRDLASLGHLTASGGIGADGGDGSDRDGDRADIYESFKNMTSHDNTTNPTRSKLWKRFSRGSKKKIPAEPQEPKLKRDFHYKTIMHDPSTIDIPSDISAANLWLNSIDPPRAPLQAPSDTPRTTAGDDHGFISFSWPSPLDGSVNAASANSRLGSNTVAGSHTVSRELATTPKSKDSAFILVPVSSEISAPHSNIPAASAMLDSPLPPSWGTEDVEKETFIAKLLSYQDFDGAFSIPESDVEQLFGARFLVAVGKLKTALERKFGLWGSPELPGVALSAAVIAILERHFGSQKALWVLIAEKTRMFLQGLDSDVDAIVKIAADCTKDVKVELGKSTPQPTNLQKQPPNETKQDSKFSSLRRLLRREPKSSKETKPGPASQPYQFPPAASMPKIPAPPPMMPTPMLPALLSSDRAKYRVDSETDDAGNDRYQTPYR
ncbi:hypothetical protein S7711_04404, partial [Stachybotrys chartarum IBT 7711]